MSARLEVVEQVLRWSARDPVLAARLRSAPRRTVGWGRGELAGSARQGECAGAAAYWGTSALRHKQPFLVTKDSGHFNGALEFADGRGGEVAAFCCCPCNFLVCPLICRV